MLIVIFQKKYQILRLFLISPDMHRMHHSVVLAEKNSNFGFNLPWWGYIFRTYRTQPQAGYLNMTTGIELFLTLVDHG